MAERPVAHHQQDDLHEALIRRAAFDLGSGKIGVLRWHQDRSAQPRFVVEPFARDPSIDGPAQRGRHIGVEQCDRAVQHIGDGEAGAEWLQRLRPHGVEACRPQRLSPAANPAARRAAGSGA